VAEQGQLAFDYDERVPRLARELAVMIEPHLAPGTPRETTRNLAARLAQVAEARLKYAWEPPEAVRCHLCDAETFPKGRVRVAVCVRCSTEPRSPGASG
jgi:hypothetical protein